MAKKAQVPASKATGRAPIQYLSVFLKSSIVYMEVGVFASQTTSKIQYRVVDSLPQGSEVTTPVAVLPDSVRVEDEAVAETDAESVASDVVDESASDSGVRSKEKFILLVEGRKKSSFKLEPEQVDDYEEFIKSIRGTDGIFVRRIVPALVVARVRAIGGFVLSDLDMSHNLASYRALHEYLSIQNRRALCYLVLKGKLSIVDIEAINEGLVLNQYAFLDEVTSVHDAVSPSWKTATVTPRDRGLLGQVLEPIESRDLKAEDLENPERRFLEKLVQNERQAGNRATVENKFAFDSLTDLLQAAVSKDSSKGRPPRTTKQIKAELKKQANSDTNGEKNTSGKKDKAE